MEIRLNILGIQYRISYDKQEYYEISIFSSDGYRKLSDNRIDFMFKDMKI